MIIGSIEFGSIKRIRVVGPSLSFRYPLPDLIGKFLTRQIPNQLESGNLKEIRNDLDKWSSGGSLILRGLSLLWTRLTDPQAVSYRQTHV